MNKRFYILMTAILVALSALIYTLGQSQAFTLSVLLLGNVLVFLLSVLSYAISSRFTNNENNAAFMRGVLGGSFLKFFLAIVLGLVYIVLNKDTIIIADIIALMIIYIIYTTVETVFLASKTRKGMPN